MYRICKHGGRIMLKNIKLMFKVVSKIIGNAYTNFRLLSFIFAVTFAASLGAFFAWRIAQISGWIK